MAGILGFGEIMLRLSTARGHVLSGAGSLDVAFGGAEANTIVCAGWLRARRGVSHLPAQ